MHIFRVPCVSGVKTCLLVFALLHAAIVVAAGQEPFTDIAAEAGLDFVHFNGIVPARRIT